MAARRCPAGQCPFQTGMEVWLESRPRMLKTARVGLIAHAASVNARGAHSVTLLHRQAGARLTAIFAPEHGFMAKAGPGERVSSARHRRLGIPVHSLYGDHRRPTAEMLADVDALVFDLQDIGARCYTYGSTLRLALEAAAECGRRVIVCDRPVPLPGVEDGPMRDPAFASFVGLNPVPLHHGLTSGELARFLASALAIPVELEVVPMRGWPSASAPWPKNRPWTPPSPAIRSVESAMTYTATVWTEALPSLDCDRTGPLSFQILGSKWMDPGAVCDAAGDLPGVILRPRPYRSAGRDLRGVRIEVVDTAAFRPVTVGLRLLAAVIRVHGPEKIWRAPGARASFFDQLAGTDRVRAALKTGSMPALRKEEAVQRRMLAGFRRSAAPHRLYAGDGPGVGISAYRHRPRRLV